MKLLYFAWLKDRIGRGSEELTPPAEVTTVAELIAWLKSRGGGYATALADETRLRVAVNQEYAAFDAVLHPGDEVALFPPVTGG